MQHRCCQWCSVDVETVIRPAFACSTGAVSDALFPRAGGWAADQPAHQADTDSVQHDQDGEIADAEDTGWPPSVSLSNLAVTPPCAVQQVNKIICLHF